MSGRRLVVVLVTGFVLMLVALFGPPILALRSRSLPEDAPDPPEELASPD